MTEEFKKDLESLLNRHCVDNDCDTPDYILADMVCDFIDAYEHAIQANINWHSNWKRLGEGKGIVEPLDPSAPPADDGTPSRGM